MMTSYVRSLMATLDYFREKGISVGWTSEYSSHVANAREATLNGGNQNDILDTRPFKGEFSYDKIIWIDSDIAWNPEDVMKLYKSDKDVISGAYLLASGEVVAYKEELGKAFTFDEVLKKTELERIHSAGFGFICVKSGIFESMTRPWFQSVPTTIQIDSKDYTFPIMGEDIAWCQRANELGFEIWFDPTVKVTHHKTMKLTWEGIKP